jgi:ABC-2 type transport system ATP-binding protein
MSDPAIETVGLTKEYAGGARALDNVTLRIEPGDAVALVGRNGAGKTTFLRILATLLKPTSGYARVNGFDGRFQASRIRRQLGYMPDVQGLYEDLTVEEYLDFFAGAYRLSPAERRDRVKALLDLMDLGPVGATPTGALSRGMQQRLGLARILVHDPKLLLLDEPASNLDPQARIEIRELLRELRTMGKTIVISSHILMELDELCNKLVVLDRGKLLYAGAIADVASRLKREVSVRVDRDAEAFGDHLRSAPDVESVASSDGWLRVRLKEGTRDFSFVVRAAAERGLVLRGLKEEEAGLEEVFLALTSRRPEAK